MFFLKHDAVIALWGTKRKPDGEKWADEAHFVNVDQGPVGSGGQAEFEA